MVVLDVFVLTMALTIDLRIMELSLFRSFPIDSPTQRGIKSGIKGMQAGALRWHHVLPASGSAAAV